MAELTVTAKGQVTLRKEVLRHLGIAPGGKLEVELMPSGQARLRAARPKGSLDSFIGCLAGLSDKKLSIEEMNEVIEKGWAGQLEDHD